MTGAVEPARAGDLEEVERMLLAHARATFRPIEDVYSRRHFAMFFHGACVTPHHLVAVWRVDGRARGLFWAQEMQSPFAPVTIADELIWWMDPEVRGARAAQAMLAAYDRWARSRGVRAQGLSAMRDDVRAFARRGYRPVERKFLKVT